MGRKNAFAETDRRAKTAARNRCEAQNGGASAKVEARDGSETGRSSVENGEGVVGERRETLQAKGHSRQNDNANVGTNAQASYDAGNDGSNGQIPKSTCANGKLIQNEHDRDQHGHADSGHLGIG